MATTRTHQVKHGEVSFVELHSDVGRRFKVTRRISDLGVSETKVFRQESRAKRQMEQWLQ